MIRSSVIMITTHVKCRGGLYPRSNIERFPVPDEKVSWSSEYKEYKPHNHTSSSIHGQPWADPNIGKIPIMYYNYVRLNMLHTYTGKTLINYSYLFRRPWFQTTMEPCRW